MVPLSGASLNCALTSAASVVLQIQECRVWPGEDLSLMPKPRDNGRG